MFVAKDREKILAGC